MEMLSDGIPPPFDRTYPKLTVVTNPPSGAVTYRTRGGEEFKAPPEANWVKVYETGKAVGFNPSRIGEFIGRFGTFDFQRQAGKGLFILPYTPASNYGVGVFMNGAGFSLAQVKILGTTFKIVTGSTAKLEDLYKWWELGWMDANSGEFAKKVPMKEGGGG
jgi:hypothetical protein